MRLFLRILFLCSIACTQQSHTAEDTPILSIQISDWQRNLTELRAHPIGNIFFDAELLSFRNYLAEQIELRQPGLLDIIQASNSLRYDIPTLTESGLPIHLQINGAYEEILSAHPEQYPADLELPFFHISAKPQRLLLTSNTDHTEKPITIKNNALVTVSWNGETLAQAIKTLAPNNKAQFIDALCNFIPQGTFESHIQEEILQHSLQLTTTPAGLQTIDTNVLKKLPASVDAIISVGINGEDWLKAHAADLYTIVASAMNPHAEEIHPESAKMQVNGMCTMLLGIDFETLIKSVNGTCTIVFNEPIFLYPNATCIFPRSEQFDMLVHRVLGMGQALPPKEGAFSFVTLKNFNPAGGDLTLGGLCIGKDSSHWIFSMDSGFTEEYLASTEQDLAQHFFAPHVENSDDLHFLFAFGSNTKTMHILPHVAGGLGNLFDRGKHAPALAKAAHLLMKEASEFIITGRSQDESTFAFTQQGLPAVMPANVAMVAIIASIAIPNLLESRITANESAAAATLKSAMSASQTMFQAGGFQDPDGNGVGGFGFIEYLTGEAACQGAEKGDINILTGGRYRGVERNGYFYEVYLPNGEKSAVTFEDGYPNTPEGIKRSERQFIIYAWPANRNETGRRIFALTVDGQIWSPNRIIDYDPKSGPDWNAAFGGGDAGWDDKVVWPQYRRY